MNYHKLHNMCNMSIRTARKLGDFVPCGNSGYTFIDNGADILGVAHLDTVQTSRKFYKTAKRVFSPRLDDRLGVYTLLHELRDLDFDVLLTEDEEKMQSTARFFSTNKKYNWLFQFDRGGTDTVMYQFENQDNVDLLEEVGIVTGIGSYSDICELDELDCSAFNFGTAYYNNHSKKAFMIVSEYRNCVSRFRDFYELHSDEYLPYFSDPVYGWGKTSRIYYPDKMYGRWESSTSTDFMLLDCPVCGMPILKTDKRWLEETGMCEKCNYWLEKYNHKIVRKSDEVWD